MNYHEYFLSFLPAIILGLLFLVPALRASRFFSGDAGVKAQAVIHDRKFVYGIRGTSHDIFSVSFKTPAGESVEAKLLYQGWKKYTIGDSIEIIYSKANPEKVTTPAVLRQWMYVRWIVLAFYVFFAWNTWQDFTHPGRSMFDSPSELKASVE